MPETAILTYARMPEDCLREIRDRLSDLDIRVAAISCYPFDAQRIQNVMPEVDRYFWNEFRTETPWRDRFNHKLYEELLAEHKATMLPLFERYRPFLGGSMEVENRAAYDFSRAEQMLDKHNPDYVLFSKQPESGIEFLLYVLARHRGIKTVMTRWGALPYSRAACTTLESSILTKDWTPHPDIIPICNLENPGEAMHPSTAKEVERIRNLGANYKPGYTQGKGDGQHWLDTFMALARKPHKIFKYLYDYQNNGPIYKRRLYVRYKRLAVDTLKPASGTKVFFPLHFQPELTTMPLGGPFVNQIKAIKLLSDALPENGCVYVKEHPSSFSTRTEGNPHFRPKYFYDWLAKIPKVSLVSSTIPSATLQEESDFTACITGTAGLEAMLRGKKVVTFGNAAFTHGPGVYEAMHTDLTELFASHESLPSVNHDDVIRFMTCIDAVCLHHPELYVVGKQRVVHNQAFFKNSMLAGITKLKCP